MQSDANTFITYLSIINYQLLGVIYGLKSLAAALFEIFQRKFTNISAKASLFHLFSAKIADFR